MPSIKGNWYEKEFLSTKNPRELYLFKYSSRGFFPIKLFFQSSFGGH